MSVYVTLRASVDPAAFEKAVAADPERIRRINEVARSKGLIGHRWFRGQNEVMAVDEWPDPESFQAFFSEIGPEIGPFMAAAGVSGQPEVKVWGQVDIDDVFGWGA